MEAGASLSTFKGLNDAVKASWSAVNIALRDAFQDEAEKELFMNNVAYFRREQRSLIEYRTELQRKMDLYFPSLKTIPAELQRQTTIRFIEGLAGDKIKAKLRRHCRKERCTIETAYQYVCDYESSSIHVGRQNRVSAGGNDAVMATISDLPCSSGEGDVFKQLREQVIQMAERQKFTELRIQELSARQSDILDRLDYFSNQLDEVQEKLLSLEGIFEMQFDELRGMLQEN